MHTPAFNESVLKLVVLFKQSSPSFLQEMMYVWNGFTVVGKRPGLTENILAILEKAEEQLGADPSTMNSTTLSKNEDGGFFFFFFFFRHQCETNGILFNV